MRSAVLKGARKIEVEKKENMVGREGYILIDVLKVGICGSDIHYWVEGNPKNLIMGHEFSGIVIDAANSKKYKEGDRVTALPISPCLKCKNCKDGNVQLCSETWTHAIGLSLDFPGGLGGRVLVREDMVRPLPNNVSYEVGAMIEPAAVGLRAANV